MVVRLDAVCSGNGRVEQPWDSCGVRSPPHNHYLPHFDRPKVGFLDAIRQGN
jgi:hypothetical protein